jgi:alpha-D-xyloside xylohydrolase
MSQSLRGGLSLGLSGFSFWSHDIAGFISEGIEDDSAPDPYIYKRWVQFGLLSSHSRLHGSHSYRVPWLVDEEASEVLGRFSRLKNSLMPYIFSQAIKCCKEGLPMLRVMLVEFPEDRTCHTLDQQYMLGESLLVAPIFNNEGVSEYYLPEGAWTGLIDGKKRIGPRWVTETFDNLHLPVLVREGHAILVGTEERPDYDWAANLTKIVVGAQEEKGTIETLVPSASKFGEFAGSVKVTDGKVEVTGDVKKTPELLKLGEDSHL